MELDKEFFVTVAITIVNILVLYFILKKLLFKPVTKFMDDRSQKIQDELDRAEDAKKQVDEMKNEYDAKLRLAKEEGQKIVEDYKKMADKEYNNVLANAKNEANLMMENAKTELAVEKEQLISGMKKEMSDLVLSASEKVLKENVDTAQNRKLISDFIENK
jgi:F-type H+-transporting ATPase subunit b